MDFKPFVDLSEADWDKVLDINLKGYFFCAQSCAKEMIKQKSGVIVNIASVAMGQQGIGFVGLAHEPDFPFCWPWPVRNARISTEARSISSTIELTR